MAVDAALVTAGASMSGDIMSQQGAQATNDKSLQAMEEMKAFNASQSQIARDYATQMADTQMQRRVADLKAANLNPALAYTQGGAAAPVVGGASAPGVPGLQNPNLGFGQLGAQVGSAEQLKSTINLQDAQAQKLDVESGSEIPAQVENLRANTGLTIAQANQVWKNVQLLSTQLEPANANDSSMAFLQQKFKTIIGQMDAETQAQTMAALIKARNDENFAVSIGAQNVAQASATDFGQLLSLFKLLGPAFTSAAQVSDIATNLTH